MSNDHQRGSEVPRNKDNGDQLQHPEQHVGAHDFARHIFSGREGAAADREAHAGAANQRYGADQQKLADAGILPSCSITTGGDANACAKPGAPVNDTTAGAKPGAPANDTTQPAANASAGGPKERENTVAGQQYADSGGIQNDAGVGGAAHGGRGHQSGTVHRFGIAGHGQPNGEGLPPGLTPIPYTASIVPGIVGDKTGDQSLREGADKVKAACHGAIKADPKGVCEVYGYSLGAGATEIAAKELRNEYKSGDKDAIPPNQLRFHSYASPLHPGAAADNIRREKPELQQFINQRPITDGEIPNVHRVRRQGDPVTDARYAKDPIQTLFGVFEKHNYAKEIADDLRRHRYRPGTEIIE